MEKTNTDWLKIAERITWFKKPTVAGKCSYHKPVSIKWFEDGELNVSYNCIDRHLAARAEQVAFMPFYLEGVAGVPSLNIADGMHPNPEGARIVEANIWKVLGPMLPTAATR
mgnify:CR=1 FL=1